MSVTYFSVSGDTFSEYCEEINMGQKARDSELIDVLFGETQDIDFDEHL